MSRNTKPIGVAFEDQYLENAELTNCTITGGTISGAVVSGGAGSFTNLTATGNVVFGNASTDTVAFYGATPQAQQTGAGQAAVATTAPVSISATQWGFSTSTQALAVITLQNSIRTALVNLGIIAGS